VSGLSAANGLLGPHSHAAGVPIPRPTPSPLAALESCFRLLCAQPGALTIDGQLHHGVPARPIPLDELRGCLHHLVPRTRLAILTVLVRRARQGSATWQVGLAGILLPGLRHLADQHVHTHPTTAEVHALTWFRAAVTAHSQEADRRIRWLLEITCATQAARPASAARSHT